MNVYNMACEGIGELRTYAEEVGFPESEPLLDITVSEDTEAKNIVVFNFTTNKNKYFADNGVGKEILKEYINQLHSEIERYGECEQSNK
jgi:hypothetical protein